MFGEKTDILGGLKVLKHCIQTSDRKIFMMLEKMESVVISRKVERMTTITNCNSRICITSGNDPPLDRHIITPAKKLTNS